MIITIDFKKGEVVELGDKELKEYLMKAFEVKEEPQVTDEDIQKYMDRVALNILKKKGRI